MNWQPSTQSLFCTPSTKREHFLFWHFYVTSFLKSSIRYPALVFSTPWEQIFWNLFGDIFLCEQKAQSNCACLPLEQRGSHLGRRKQTDLRLSPHPFIVISHNSNCMCNFLPPQPMLLLLVLWEVGGVVVCCTTATLQCTTTTPNYWGCWGGGDPLPPPQEANTIKPSYMQ